MRFAASNSADSLSDTGYANSLDDDDSKYSSTNSRLQPQVPPLILSCIDHLSSYGLNVVGIFRVSTSKRRIREVSISLHFVPYFGLCGILKIGLIWLFSSSVTSSFEKSLIVAHLKHSMRILALMTLLHC